MRHVLIAPLLAAAISIVPANIAAAADAAPAAEIKLDIKSCDEVMQLVASKKGKIVVLDAWSTYCDPCMAEFPGLVALHKQYGPDKIACISLCANFVGLGKVEDEIAAPLEFLKAQGATFDNVLSKDADDVLYKKFQVQSVPAVFIYDRDGKLIKVFENELTYKQVGEFLAPLMK